jgi:hypothetical protein
MMARFVDPFYVNNAIDANILDNVADGEDAAVAEIVRLSDEGEITLMLPYSVQAEIENPSTPDHVKAAARQFIFSQKVTITSGERGLYEKLLAEASGDAETKNIAADLLHVFEAAKYGGYFITRDKRLLKRRSVIGGLLQLDVVTPGEFLSAVEKAKTRRADQVRGK